MRFRLKGRLADPVGLNATRRRAAGGAAALAILSFAGAASASTGLDSPEGGVVQMGRGSAWVARADDPMAVYYNPASLAFQPTGVYVGVSLMFPSRCFTRLGPDGKQVLATPGQPDPTVPFSRGKLPPTQVCDAGSPFPNPGAAGTFRINREFAVGIALAAPHSAGNQSWPETLPYTNNLGIANKEPAPQRYLLISSSALIVNPTVSVSYAPLKNLSFGAGFIWGIATAQFVNFSEGLSPKPPAGKLPTDDFLGHQDIRAQLSSQDLFIPGFVLGALWAPAEMIDVGGWFKWQDSIDSDADLTLQRNYFQSDGTINTATCTAKLTANCIDTTTRNVGDPKGSGHLTAVIPAEAKIGARFHVPRAAGKAPDWAKNPERPVRDPLSQDLFDVEADFTWAGNSAAKNLTIRFPTGQNAIAVKGASGAVVPENGDIPQNWRDVFGVHLGGDFNVIQNLLALRAGGWYESKGQDDKYLSLAFDVAEKIGLSGGATVRFGPVDVSVAYQHTIYGTLDNGGDGAIHGLSGDPTAGNPPRTRQAVNGGSLTSSLDEVALGGTVRF